MIDVLKVDLVMGCVDTYRAVTNELTSTRVIFIPLGCSIGMVVNRVELRYFLLHAEGHEFAVYKQYGDLIIRHESAPPPDVEINLDDVNQLD